MMSKVRCLHGL